MKAAKPVKRLVAFIEFSGEPQAARELSTLIRYFLEGSMFQVESLSPTHQTRTLKVYESD